MLDFILNEVKDTDSFPDRTALLHTLKLGNPVIYYQPQLNTTTEEIIGMEALVYWKHPQFGLLPAHKFIPLAEETGLITPINEWVLKTACAQCKVWHDAGFSHLKVAVNIFEKQFQQPNFLENLKHILLQTGLSPQFLQLEICERLMVHNIENNPLILEKLHQMGVNLSIDNFGTGYSSFSHLKIFPIANIKIDQTFINEVMPNSKDFGIINAIIILAKGLNINVIAQGVKTEAQKKLLQTLNCEQMQGYLFSKPLLFEETNYFLQNSWLTLDKNYS